MKLTRKWGNRLLAPLAVLALMPVSAFAHDAQGQQAAYAQIPFVNNGGINDWRSVGESTVYFEDNFHHWYRAQLMMPAVDLPFAFRIGIDTGPGGTLDRFGAITVDHQRYPFSSFVQVNGPPPAKAHHGKKAVKTVTAPG